MKRVVLTTSVCVAASLARLASPTLGQSSANRDTRAAPQAEAKSQVDPDSTLHDAITKMDLQGIELALSRGANPNGLLSRMSVLQWALMCFCAGSSEQVDESEQQACVQMVAMLFNAGAKLSPKDRQRVLFSPVSSGYCQVVEMLLSKGAAVDGGPGNGLTWVEVAEARNRKAMVDLLVRHGGKRIPPEDARQLRLVHAADAGDLRLLEKAIREGALVDEADKTGITPLCQVVADVFYNCEQYAMVLFLLMKGADPNKEGRERFEGIPGIPLHTAIAMTAMVFKDARTGSRLAMDGSFYGRLVLEALLDGGAHVAGRAKDGRTPLHIAAQSDNLVAAEMLLKAGSTIMPRDDAGRTPLDCAESAEMIRLLKANGAIEK